jgi:hypothetical protein
MFRIIYLHGVPTQIVSDRGTQSISKFWERLHETLDTHLNFSSAYHPQIDGQTERVNQILEDMLRAYALQYRRSSNKSIPYAEFSYNYSYQQSLKMTLFEMLYDHRCRSPSFQNETRERKILELTYCTKPRYKFVRWESICGLCSQDRSAIPTIDEENWVLKLEITCTSRCHLCEVYNVSRYEASSHLGSLVHSRSRRREKKNWRHNLWITFSIRPNLEDEIHFKGGRFVTPQNSKI